MPSKDLYGEVVKTALIKDGWIITDDPLTLSFGGKDVYVYLGAERTLGAEKNGQKIAVEIKSFIGHSEVKDLRDAIGQYVMYRDILIEIASGRILFLSITEVIYRSVFDAAFGRLFIDREKVNLLVFDPLTGVIKKWLQH